LQLFVTADRDGSPRYNRWLQ